MPRGMHPLQRGDFFHPTRETNWHHPVDRTFNDLPQDGRFAGPQPSPMHPHALVSLLLFYNQEKQKLRCSKTIEAALRDCVRLPVKEFALIVLLESGDEKTYTSRSLTPRQSKIFREQFITDFRRSARRGTAESAYPGSGVLTSIPCVSLHGG
jgi:hypothetical protein